MHMLGDILVSGIQELFVLQERMDPEDKKNDDLMFFSSIRVAMTKNHANDESQTTCERQWPDLNPSKSLFLVSFSKYHGMAA